MKHRVVVEILGGVASAVFSDLPNEQLEVIVIDWDNIKQGDTGYLWAHGPLSDMSEDTLAEIEEIDFPDDSAKPEASEIPDGPEYKSYRFFEDRGLTSGMLTRFEESTNSEDWCWLINAPCMTGVALFAVIHGFAVSQSGIRQRPNKWYAGNDVEGEGVDAVVDAEGKVLWVHESRKARIMGESSAIIPEAPGS